MTILSQQWRVVKGLTARSWRYHMAVWASATAASLLGACSEEPVDGQVIAAVNGQEITIPELNEEARAQGLVIGDDRTVRDALIVDLVERKLLVDEARRRKLDRTPGHVLAQRRVDETLLATELVAAMNRQLPEPSKSEIARFIASRPFAFAQRKLVSVDRVRAQGKIDAATAKALGQAATLEHANAQLESRGIRGERRVEMWDSATLPPAMATQMLSPAASGIQLFTLPDEVILARVLGSWMHPTAQGDSARLARELIRSEASRQSLQGHLERQKAHAKIRYQVEFAPPSGR